MSIFGSRISGFFSSGGGGGSTLGFVPYTGATQSVNLGEYGITTGFTQYDTSPSTYTPAVGNIGWNDTDGTLEFELKGGNVTLQIGQEEVVRVVNKSGGNLTEAGYQAVRVLGAQGQRLSVELAQGNNDDNSQDTLGLVTENIAVNQEGFVTASGLVRGIDTTGNLQGETWAEGDPLYLSPTTAGRITNILPTAPQHTVRMGYVIVSNANNGSIFVKVDNGYEIGELHNCYLPSPSNNDGIFWNTTNLRYQNASIQTILGYTPLNASISAFSFPANNTSGSANMTANTFNDKGQQVYSGAITWTGTTAPSGATSHTYSWTQIGKMVSLRINLVYAVAGTAVSQVAMALPSDCPNPIDPTGLGSANEIIMSAYGYLLLTSTTQNSAFQRAYLRVNSTDTGYELLIAGGGANYKLAYITINYWTT